MFNSKNNAAEVVISTSKKLTGATIDVWDKAKRSLLPTPFRFHYIFNMRELSRVFQGIMETPINVIPTADMLVLACALCSLR